MELFKLLGKIAVDGTVANQEIDKVTGNASGSSKSMGKSFTTMAKVVSGAIASIAFGKLTNNMIHAADVIQQESSMFSAVFGDNADAVMVDVERLAGDIGKLPGQLAPAFTKMSMSWMGAGKDMATATALTEQQIRLAADASAFFGGSIAETNDKMTQWLKGNTAVGPSLGIVAQQADIAAYYTDKTGKSWEDLNAEGRKLARLDFTENWFANTGVLGYAEENSKSLANSTNMLSFAWKDFLSIPGGPLLEKKIKVVDALKNAIVWLTETIRESTSVTSFLMNVWDSLSGTIQNVVIAVGILTVGFTAQYIAMNKIYFKYIAIKKLMALKIAVTKGLALALGGLKTAFAILTGPIGLITMAIAGLVIGMRHLWTTNEGFRNFVIGAWENITNIISKSIETIKSLFNDWDGTIVSLGQTFLDFFKNADPEQLMEKFKKLIPAIIGILIGGIPALLLKGTMMISAIADGMGVSVPELLAKVSEMIISVIDKIVESLPEFLQQGIEILTSIIEGMTAMLPEILETVILIVTTIIEQFVELLPLILGVGIEFLVALIDGILDTLPVLIETAILITDTLISTVISLLPVILQTGMDILFALISGIVEILPMLISTALELIATLVRVLIENLPQIISAGWEILKALIKGILELKYRLTKVAIELIIELVKTLVSGVKDLHQAGRDLVRGLIDGIKSMFGAVGRTAKDLGRRVLDGVKGFLKINSPSRVMRDQVGKPIAQGVADGIDADTKNIDRSMDNMNKVMTQSADTGAKNVSREFVEMRNSINKTVNEIPPIVARAMAAMNKALSSGMRTANSIVREGVRVLNNTMSTLRDSFHFAGLNAMRGLNQGLLNGRAQVMNTARNIANDVAKTMRQALDINSPSRVMMEIGKFAGEGLEIGLNDSISDVRQVSRALSASVIPQSGQSSFASVGSSNEMAELLVLFKDFVNLIKSGAVGVYMDSEQVGGIMNTAIDKNLGANQKWADMGVL